MISRISGGENITWCAQIVFCARYNKGMQTNDKPFMGKFADVHNSQILDSSNMRVVDDVRKNSWFFSCFPFSSSSFFSVFTLAFKSYMRLPGLSTTRPFSTNNNDFRHQFEHTKPYHVSDKQPTYAHFDHCQVSPFQVTCRRSLRYQKGRIIS